MLSSTDGHTAHTNPQVMLSSTDGHTAHTNPQVMLSSTDGHTIVMVRLPDVYNYNYLSLGMEY